MAEHDVLALLIGVFIDGQEVLIHLQNVPGDFPDQVQGTVADSEVIHGGIDAGFLQRAGHALEIAELHVRDRLCQLDFNQFVRDLVPVHNLQDVFRQAQVDQVPAGEVDGDADRLAAFVQPAPQVPADLIQHIEVQFADIHGLFQVGNVFRRHHQGAVAVPPAQGFRPGNGVILQADLGLIENQELPVFQADGELGADLHEPVLFRHQLFACVNNIPGIPAPGGVVGAGEPVHDVFDLVEIVVIGNQKDPGAGGDHHTISFIIGNRDALKTCQDFIQFFFEEYRHEVVSPQAADNAVRADDLFNGIDIFSHGLVADLPPELAVDQGEMAQVETGESILVDFAGGTDLFNGGMKEAVIAVARVVEEGSLLHQACGAQAADHGEHQALDHFDPLPLHIGPWFDAFGAVSFAVRHHDIAENRPAGDDLCRFLPAVIAGEHSAAPQALLFRAGVILRYAFAHTERDAHLPQDGICFLNVEVIQIRDCVRQILQILRKQDVLIHGKRSAFFFSFENHLHHTGIESEKQPQCTDIFVQKRPKE